MTTKGIVTAETTGATTSTTGKLLPPSGSSAMEAKKYTLSAILCLFMQ
jgi:hypothetical protein